MQRFPLGRPLRIGLARDLPFLPVTLEQRIQGLAQWLQLLLPPVPDHVDLGVVGDALQRDMRHPLVDETLADVAARGLAARDAPRDFGFLQLAFGRVGQQVVRIARTHDAGASQCQRHTRGVDGDPAAAPLLGDVGRGARAAGGVKHEVAGIGGHEDATFYNLQPCLDYVSL